MAWELWSNDYFDRDADPCLQASGEDFIAACAALWRKTVDEGVMEDGRPTFTWFQLRWDGGSLNLPRDPFSNPELARVKPWLQTAGVIDALAKALAAQLDDAKAEQILAQAREARDAGDLCERLGYRGESRPRPRRS